MRRAWICLCLFLLAFSCAQVTRNTEAGSGTAPARGLPIGPCLAGQTVGCPDFLAAVIQNAIETCQGAGGSLRVGPGDGVWPVDINRDEKAEYLVDISMAAVCEGAPGIFSCGSLGCPKTLYEHAGDAWRIAGYLFLQSADQLVILPSGDLRIDNNDGAVQDFYQRTGAQYQLSYLRVQGYRVEVLASPHGLRSLTAATNVYAEPRKSGRVLQRYDAGTEVAVIGMTDNGFYYVSPCNACARGFVLQSGVASRH